MISDLFFVDFFVGFCVNEPREGEGEKENSASSSMGFSLWF